MISVWFGWKNKCPFCRKERPIACTIVFAFSVSSVIAPNLSCMAFGREWNVLMLPDCILGLFSATHWACSLSFGMNSLVVGLSELKWTSLAPAWKCSRIKKLSFGMNFLVVGLSELKWTSLAPARKCSRIKRSRRSFAYSTIVLASTSAAWGVHPFGR